MIRDILATSRGLLGRLLRDDRGPVALEFAFVFPAFLLVIFGIFEFVLLLFDYQTGTDATRQGVRTALIEPPVAEMDNLGAGVEIECSFSGGSVSCSGGPVIADTEAAVAIFQTILSAMQQSMPEITDANVKVIYSWSQVDAPGGVRVTPLVTVRLENVQHELFMLPQFAGLPTSFTLPDFSSSRLAHTRIR